MEEQVDIEHSYIMRKHFIFSLRFVMRYMKSGILCCYSWTKLFFFNTSLRSVTTELDRENLDFLPYLISHWQKIGTTCVLLATRSEVADCVCVALQVWSAQCGRNISALEVTQRYSVSLPALFGKDPTRPNFCSIADGAIIRGGIGSLGSPYLILWM